MTESQPHLAKGDEYVVVYAGGPSDGQTDKRISTDGTWDDSVTVLASESGAESLINYDATTWKEVGGTYFVTYVYDPKDSEALEDPEGRE